MMNQNQLEKIWNKRIKWLDAKTWNGSDPKCGFDFSNGIQPHITYEKENWNDLMIKDFRALLRNSTEGIIPKGFHAIYTTDGVQLTTLKSIQEPAIRIDVTQLEEQTYCILYVAETGVFSVSWYKSRGGIDSIINLEYGSAVTLEELTDILIALRLEEEDNN